MIGNLLFWMAFLLLVKQNAATYFHEPSYVVLSSPESKVDFGYTTVYHPNNNSLVVGAPFSDLNGKVYTCTINLLLEKKTICDEIPIDVDKLVPTYSRSESPYQHFGLGASIAVTPDYILSCAPLLTKDLDADFGACGTCFITNGTSTNRYYGTAEQYEKNENNVNINDFYGGVGWTTLSDVENKMILISKPLPDSTIHLMDMDQPLSPTEVVKVPGISNYYYQGRAFAYGVFFTGHKKLYAFSAESNERTGFIAFMYYNEHVKRMELLRVRNSKSKSVLIKDSNIGSMYGASLHGADFNSDNFTELLVGAPAQAYSEQAYENGAVHIYLGGEYASTKTRPTVCICSTKDASRFGSAIATTDLDGDGFEELFVSAPYEDYSKGAVYIFSGHVVNRLLQNKDDGCVLVSSLVKTQRIQNDGLQTLGFSLQVLPVPKFEEYGVYLLAMGSPLSGKVALYRSIPFITVVVSALLKGAEIVREQDENFTVSVTVEISYPSIAIPLSGELLVSTCVIGEMAWIESGKFKIMLSEKRTEVVTDIVIHLGNNDPGRYNFTAEVQSDIENLKRIDYDSTLVSISPQSTLLAQLDVIRKCTGDECTPVLSLKFAWSGRNDTHYLLGSTASENMTVIIRNDGNTTFGSCARIKVTGAQIALIGCNKEQDGWYKCYLPNIERHRDFPISINFDMSRPTNKDDNLLMEVLLYNTCTSNANGDAQIKKMAYSFSTEDIHLNSVHFNRNITDREIENVDTGADIEINELYTITNNESLSWNLKEVVINLEMQPFIKDYLIPADLGACAKKILERYISYKCTVDLLPYSTLKILTVVRIAKEEILKNLKNKTLEISSNFTIRMEPTSKELVDSCVTKILYQQDISFGENIKLIALIAVLVAGFVMAIFVFILYKVGFFKRKEKNDLNRLKESIRRQSTRRENVTKTETPEKLQKEEDTESNISDTDIEIIEDGIPLQERHVEYSSDLTTLIENDSCKN